MEQFLNLLDWIKENPLIFFIIILIIFAILDRIKCDFIDIIKAMKIKSYKIKSNEKT